MDNILSDLEMVALQEVFGTDLVITNSANSATLALHGSTFRVSWSFTLDKIDGAERHGRVYTLWAMANSVWTMVAYGCSLPTLVGMAATTWMQERYVQVYKKLGEKPAARKVVSVSYMIDPEPRHPRRSCDHESRLVILSRKYERNGDVDYSRGLSHDSEAAAKLDMMRFDDGDVGDRGLNPNDPETILRDFASRYLSLPVYVYDHGRVTFSTSPFSCRWDSGQVGFIAITREAARKLYGARLCTAEVCDKALKELRYEVEQVARYASGEVYGISVKFDDGSEESCYDLPGTDWDANGGIEFVKGSGGTGAQLDPATWEAV